MCVCNLACTRVCLQSGLHPRQLRLVHSGVNPERMRTGDRRRGRASLGLSDAQRLLLCVATLTDHKGHRYLLSAMPRLIAKHPQIVLALAGDGDLTQELKEQAAALGVQSHTRFLGYRQDIPDLMHAADLFVMPSHLEGLGTSLLDAMFARVPIVTTGAGGIAEVAGVGDADGPVVFLARPRDPESLEVAIAEALASPGKCAAMVDRAQQRALKFFTADGMVEGTIGVYRELLRSSATTNDFSEKAATSAGPAAASTSATRRAA
jgi:glycosyltransferase involved in cell wall biosynthesis